MELNIDVFIEGRFDTAIGFWRNDGDTFTLANEVVDMMHDALRADGLAAIEAAQVLHQRRCMSHREITPQIEVERKLGEVPN